MRQVNISGESTNVIRKPQVEQYEEIQNTGKVVAKIGAKIAAAGGAMKGKAKKAQTKAQTSKYGTAQNAKWDSFNADQKGNFNAETHTEGVDKLFNEQRTAIENNKDLTPEAKANLTANLDTNTAGSIKIFEGNEANARVKSALVDSEEEILFHVRSGDAESATRVVDMNIQSGLISGNERAGLVREIDTGVQFSNVMDTIEKISNEADQWSDFAEKLTQHSSKGVSRTETLNEISEAVYEDKQYSEAQQSKLQRTINTSIRNIATDQAALGAEISGDIARGEQPLEKIALIEDPLARQTLYNNAEGGARTVAKAKDVTAASVEQGKINKGLGSVESINANVKDPTRRQTLINSLDLYKKKGGTKADKLAGEWGSITADGGDKVTYRAYTPLVRGKTDPNISKKSKTYEVTPSVHLGRIQDNLTLLELTGSVKYMDDMKGDIVGPDAVQSMWHEINAIPENAVRKELSDRLVGIVKANNSISYTYEASDAAIPPALKPFVTSFNKSILAENPQLADTSQSTVLQIDFNGDSELISAYANGMEALFRMNKMSPKSLSDPKKSELVVKMAMAPFRAITNKRKVQQALGKPKVKLSAKDYMKGR